MEQVPGIKLEVNGSGASGEVGRPLGEGGGVERPALVGPEVGMPAGRSDGEPS